MYRTKDLYTPCLVLKSKAASMFDANIDIVISWVQTVVIDKFLASLYSERAEEFLQRCG